MDSSTQKAEFLRSQAAHYRQTLKEARLVIVIWFIGLVSCTSVILLLGYPPANERPPNPPLVWGMPAWVVWGLFVPWFVQIALTWWFAARHLQDDEPFFEFPHDEP